MIMRKNILTIVTIFSTAFFLYAQVTIPRSIPDSSKLDVDNLFDMTLDELLRLKIDNTDRSFSCYGFINTNLEQVFQRPTIDDDGTSVVKNGPLTWTRVRDFHIYGNQNISSKISVFFNLARNEREGLEIRNAYGNFELEKFFQVQVGKMYRNFGLYNSKLDQTPSFIGIEPPELFDIDHLFLTRTTSFALHGVLPTGENEISYFLSTENGEGGAKTGILPLGWDLRYKSDATSLIIGTSGYTSGGYVSPIRDITSPKSYGGVLPWMDKDKFYVFGVFVEKKLGRFLIQSEYYTSPHTAMRNASQTLEIVEEANISRYQRDRFLGNNASKSNVDLTEEDVVRKVSYVAQTWYIRLGYDIPTRVGQFVPYLFLDYIANSEIIQNQNYGGDNEAGISDDGVFYKPSLGLLYRPQQEVAIKLDASVHTQKVNGAMVSYPEIRLDFSFAFDVLKRVKR